LIKNSQLFGKKCQKTALGIFYSHCTHSALVVSHFMRYINSRLTYNIFVAQEYADSNTRQISLLKLLNLNKNLHSDKCKLHRVARMHMHKPVWMYLDYYLTPILCESIVPFHRFAVFTKRCQKVVTCSSSRSSKVIDLGANRMRIL